jgi:hypothetical protein
MVVDLFFAEATSSSQRVVDLGTRLQLPVPDDASRMIMAASGYPMASYCLLTMM